MAALFSSRNRRRDDQQLGRDAYEDEVTPTPVAVSIRGDALPAPVSRPLPARPVGLRRLAVGAAALTLFVGGTLAVTGAPKADAESPIDHAAAHALMTHALSMPLVAPEAETRSLAVAAPNALIAPTAPTAPIAPITPRADAHIIHEGYGHVPGGVVFIPSTFSSADGTYDLYLHFHGNTRVVLESAEYAGLNAVVAVVNLGVNSAPYLDAYETPKSFIKLLDDVDRSLAERGLDHAKLRRVAIGSWSGGYGAISRIVEHDRGTDALDAILVLDGIHCGWLPDNPKALNVQIISPFLKAAKDAAQGRWLFSITHSEIEPPDYAGTYATSSYLLDAVGGTRSEPQSAPEHVQLRAAVGAVSKKLEKFMDPINEATVGSFHVRGYRGNTPEHHMAHLLQMGATVMPELAQRWRTPAH